LNAHFSQSFNYSVPPLDQECSFFTASGALDDLLCTVDEVEHLLSSVDTSKASGPDGISARMLRSTAAGIAPAVTALFNLSLIRGQLPSDWKRAQVVPIPKCERRSNPSNYRPVSLLPIVSKLLEKYVRAYLLDFLQTSTPNSTQQRGFSKGKSTTGALLSATHAWHLALEAGNEVCCVFLDLTKAFDKVPHKPLLQKLEEIGINMHLLIWLHAYLCQRTQFVVVNGERSTCSRVISGVPQGSVLGPLLFVIYMDGITQVPLQDGTFLLLYADDILLYRRVRGQEDFLLLQQDIVALEQWLQQKHLQLNTAKCRYMVLSRKRHPSQPEQQLNICGMPMERVHEYKYLGVCLTHNLS